MAFVMLPILVLMMSTVLYPLQSVAQVLDTLPVQRPNQIEGTRFLVSFMENEITIQPSGLRLRVLVATAYPNTVDVVFPDGRQQRYRLGAYETLPLVLSDTFEVRQTEMPQHRAIEIRAELPISVFAMSSQYTTSDSYAALPVELWSTEYTVVSIPNDTYGDGLGSPVHPADIRQSEFLIIAAEDHTQIEIFPTASTEGGKTARQWHTITLDAGHCYLVKAAPTQQGTGDLSGTLIRATKPIGVLSGHVRASVPIGLPPTLDSKDHLVEMLLPNSMLGWSYMTVPFATGGRIPSGDYLRAVAIAPDTRLTVYTEREDLTFVLANVGDTLTLPRVNSPSWWQATKPFALVQLMTTGSIANSIMFDPAMVIGMPIGRYVSRAVFQAPANLNDATFSRQFDRHWINVICDERASRLLKLDGKYVASTVAPELATQKFRSSGMFWAQIPITPGVHVLQADSGVFTGVLYGMGYTDSYAHPIGVTSFIGRDTVVPSLVVKDSCGWLIGVASDNGGSGVAYVVVDPDSTYNYELRVENDPGGIQFRAVLRDPFRDANIAVIVRDRAGNGVRYRYRYTAPVIDLVPRPIRFVAATIGQQVCHDAFFRNFSFRDTLIVSRVHLVSGGAFEILPSNVPLLCLPRREVKVTVCYSASVEGEQRDTLVWDIGCGRTFRQPIVGRTPLPELTINDIDFGDVRIGDSLCRTIPVINSGTEPITIVAVMLDSGSYRILPTNLPRLLAPGDSLVLTVCFVPRDTGISSAVLVIVNDRNLQVRARVTGVGVRPLIVTQLLDCGPRRVGVRFDTAAHIYNRGTANATLVFRGQAGDRTVFLHSLQPDDSVLVPRSGSAAIPVRFSPQIVGTFSGTLDFTDDNGAPVTIVLSGRGTLPALSMRDTTLGPVAVGNQ
ncbi:MAG: choice-of-anchor D domain-containing protein, partial [Chlorobi bacterium]|nr:choice-of-anchor D domain-containing protein [Chlorobiota bacterium]